MGQKPKPPRTFEVPLITAAAVGGERWFHEKETELPVLDSNQKHRSQIPVCCHYTNRHCCPYRNLYQKWGSLKRNHSYRTGISIKMLSSYLYVPNTLHKFSWEHWKALSIMLNNFKALAIIVVLKRGVFVRLNTFRCSVNKLDFYHYYTSIPHKKYTSCIRQKHCSEADYWCFISLISCENQNKQAHQYV